MHLNTQLTFIAKWKRTWKILFGCLIVYLLVLLFLPLPKPLFVEDFSSVVFDNDGNLLDAKVARDEQWRFPISEDIPKELVTATLLAEDEYFYFHCGFNPVSLFRAALQNWKAGKIISGGSTLTMQLIRMALKNPPRTFPQKFYEILLSHKLEILKTKKYILREYLAQAPYGGNIVGANSASWIYFGRSLEQLSRAEYALLAVLPNHPGFLYPGKNNEQLLQKRNRLLLKWSLKEKWKKTELDVYQAEPLPRGKKSLPHLAAHLLQRSTQPELQTTLDKGTQIQVKRILDERATQWERLQIMNAACLVVSIKTGDVKAYVGNVLPESGKPGRQVDLIKSSRSPGSLLKPFLYAQAIKRGLILPHQWLPDYPIYIQGFAPSNFNKTFQGVIPADRALASSLNVPFVHLLNEYGYPQFHQDLLDAGVQLHQPADHYGSSLILGGMETTLEQIVGMYRQMAHNYQDQHRLPFGQPFLEVEPKISYSRERRRRSSPKKNGWYDPFSIPSMLRAMTMLRRPGDLEHWDQFGASTNIAWKTGTSYGYRDAWSVGISNEYVVGVWVGNADGQGRPDLIGSKMAAPVMFDVFQQIAATSIEIPENGTALLTCALTGYKAGRLCPQKDTILFPKQFHNTLHCPYHQRIWVDSARQFRVTKNCYEGEVHPDTILNLPPLLAPFSPYSSTAPVQFHPNCLATEIQLSILYPPTGTVVSKSRNQSNQEGTITLTASHSSPRARLFWFVDQEYVGLTENEHKVNVPLLMGQHTLSIQDETGQWASTEFEVIP